MIKDIGVYSKNNNNKIRLNSNESPVELKGEKLNALQYILKNIELNRYPDSNSDALREAYSKYVEVKKENIIAGNGSDEMLNLVISKVISKGDKILTLSTDFGMYDFYTNINQGEVIKYNLDLDKGFNVDDFINLALVDDVKLILFSNPNNPTGYGFTIKDIRKILDTFKDKIILVDEAYYEFYGESVISLINEYKNLLVTRTLSKAWGLAALRIGFLIGNEGLIEELLKYKTPYNINSLSQEVAISYLKNSKELLYNLEIIISERESLYKALKEIEEEIFNKYKECKIKFYPSKGNFIYGKTTIKDKLIEILEKEDINIRYFQDDSFRITIGLEEENSKLLEAIKKILL
ncbi:MAG: histidinol-phosphate transaminase [Clostridium sp.]|uniref:histidinol-phosphate transaminase n=1 Tax=Clostridium sp. TaxID=1506 RepID=UPI0025B82266|nr:histidinol-phosphate transaminase [Clostridium sp.]MCF0147631.1 histidinol-phosphate transaminase [Clostridium sp.]